MEKNKEYICLDCKLIATPKKSLRGNEEFELASWVIFSLLGLLYSIYRRFRAKKTCPNCGGKNLILMNEKINEKIFLDQIEDINKKL